jgi:hypothetical protein
MLSWRRSIVIRRADRGGIAVRRSQRAARGARTGRAACKRDRFVPSRDRAYRIAARWLWLPATRQGDAACRRYRHAARSGGNRRRWTVGGVAIHRDRLQTLFNYGEGDQIAVWNMAMQAPGVSRVQSSTTIDGEDRAPSTVSLKRVRDLLDC